MNNSVNNKIKINSQGEIVPSDTLNSVSTRFNFDNFLNELELGNIVLDFRCGVYKDEKRFGRMHDRGPAWRLRKNIWKDIMTRVTSKYIYVN